MNILTKDNSINGYDNWTALCQVSNEIYEMTQLIHVAKTPIGLFGLFLNAIGALAIWNSPTLRSKPTFIFIAYSSVAQMIFGAGTFTDSVVQMEMKRKYNCVATTELACFYQRLLRETGMFLTLGGQLMTANDRLMAVIFPHWYKNSYTKAKVFAEIGLAQIATVLYTLYRFLTVENVWIPVCSALSETSKCTLQTEQYICISVYLLTVAIYTVLLAILHRRHKVSPGLDNDQRQSVKNKIMTTLFITCLVNSATTALASILRELALKLDDAKLSAQIGSFAIVADLCGCFYFLIFITRSTQYRCAVVQLFSTCWSTMKLLGNSARAP